MSNDLFCDNIDAKPITFDFGQGYAETWEVVEPDFAFWTAERCVAYADDNGIDMPDDAIGRAAIVEALESIGVACYDDESDDLLREAYLESVTSGDLADIEAWREACREDWLSSDRGAPMMNYYYPINLREPAGAAATKLLSASLPLTIVSFLDSDDYVLALTGGGMDLGAEICQAYIALGQRPPVHFCRVPRMSGTRYSKEFLATLIESCEIAQRWAQNTIDALRAIAADPDYSEQ